MVLDIDMNLQYPPKSRNFLPDFETLPSECRLLHNENSASEHNDGQTLADSDRACE